jgi:hypothetical protein
MARMATELRKGNRNATRPNRNSGADRAFNRMTNAQIQQSTARGQERRRALDRKIRAILGNPKEIGSDTTLGTFPGYLLLAFR